MNMRLHIATKLTSSVAVCACLLLVSSRSVAQNSEPLSLASTVSISDVHGRIDHFGVDIKGERLFMAAVGNGTLEVIDLKSGKRVHAIANLDEPQGVFYDPATNRLFVACGGDGVTRIFDGTTFQPVGSVKFPDDADNIRYDQHNKNIVVGYAGSKQLRNRETGSGGLGFITADGKRAGDIVIDAHPESFQLEESGSRVFVNVPDKKEIEVADVPARKILARWPVSCDSNFPMALDEAHHRLVVACREPARLLVFDTGTGKQTTSVEFAGHSDDLFYDARRARVYVLSNAGFVDVFQQADPDHYSRIAHIPTAPGAQTGLFVPALDKLFVGVPGRDKQPAAVRVYQAR
jgi:DNA-binding beta-propeller fold protein YncE